MRLLFEEGGRGGMRDAEAVAGCLGAWKPRNGPLYAEIGPENNAWWSNKNSPQPVLLRSVEQLAEIARTPERHDAIGAKLWAEAEALALRASTASQWTLRWKFERPAWLVEQLIFSHDELAQGIAFGGREPLMVSFNGGPWRQALSSDQIKAENQKIIETCKGITNPNDYGIERMRLSKNLARQVWTSAEAGEIAQAASPASSTSPRSL